MTYKLKFFSLYYRVGPLNLGLVVRNNNWMMSWDYETLQTILNRYGLLGTHINDRTIKCKLLKAMYG